MHTYVSMRSQCHLLLLLPPCNCIPFSSYVASSTPPRHIMHLSMPTILNKMGLHCNLPWSVIFAPHALGGIRLCNLAHEHTVQQLSALLHHLRAQTTPLGQAMETLVCTYQLWVGQQCPVLEDTTPCLWIPNHWLLHLQASMHANNFEVTNNAWTIPALCKHECYLMDDFKDYGFS